MKILIFLHGTTIMHRNAAGKTQGERVQQSLDREESVLDYESYIPIGSAVEKLSNWKRQGAEIIYLGSHESEIDVERDKLVLRKYNFPEGEVLFRRDGESYKDIAERIIPDILIEDDCESIGGEKEMTITFVIPEIRQRIKSIVVKEFQGIDYLPDDVKFLRTWE
ncbi:MAG: hypothetical protein A2951_02200 [Candidatus Buchananbacteria bacterium RIFCSPLOWO2_01_FULL_56_15]|uniref:Uncharacterized protein n=2 Tax=Candidatus Buchananiibacteriota TaxID=1817903 RepID=A0A1G1YDV2_9BACT|nr:MAG: hypothetical protein A3J59_00065 [Candidatus Buchananbacteria bacterium RIFCSPHIGHO2_02_FULL_56_16]OGY54779.1 MAG: hypothetical protein A2951_02200 [Candidatus Buchananbacteria bacterium RIFCSPLOWO2_01_FULL_56_15]